MPINQKTVHILNVFIYAYTTAREQVGLPARTVLNADGQLIHDKPGPLEKPLTPQIEAMENHFLERYFELDELFWGKGWLQSLLMTRKQMLFVDVSLFLSDSMD